MQNPRITFITTPLRSSPTRFPPYAVLSIIKSLKTSRFNNNYFYNIDYLRPSIEEAVQHIIDQKTDILAISAVVSTSYNFVKKLTLRLKSLEPTLTVILGGPMGASAEILLRKTGVDYVCISEGEPVMVEFVEQYSRSRKITDPQAIPGLVFLKDDKVVSSGYADTLSASELYDVDYSDFNDLEELQYYIPPPSSSDPVLKAVHADGKRATEIPGSKGCVAKCTFCHRWDKGIRYIPVPIIMDRLQRLKDDFNVGFISMSDENFGTDKKWLAEFCSEIKKLEIPWAVAGMRVNCISDDLLALMKDSGCVRCYFGMETGSARMLKIMNKGVTLQDNYEAIKLINEHGLDTTIQLVLGMPGETNGTIRETAEFLRYSVRLNKDRSPFEFSANYAQALPGTPLYEYARQQGYIGENIDDEEKYLIWVSDKNAADDNFVLDGLSGQPQLKTLSWRQLLLAASLDAYLNEFGWRAYFSQLGKKFHPTQKHQKGYFNFPAEERKKIKPIASTLSWVRGFLRHPVALAPSLFFRSRSLLYTYVVLRALKKSGTSTAFLMVLQYLNLAKFAPTQLKEGVPYQSLRKTVFSNSAWFEKDPPITAMLRKGRW